MTLFLTSSPSGCPFEPGPAVPVLDRRNHFLENLRAVWPDHPVRGLAIAADPHAYAQNDEMCRVFLQSFADAHLPLTELVPCDARNQEEIGTLLPRSGFVMLCGGHVPTQNHFFAQLGLPGLFHNYHGIVLGVSAGSMNAARLVYAAPEEPGEAADPGYCRWLNGLGLTKTRILPHYQFIREHILDGQRMEDIALADSRKRHFLALPDGSYLMCSDGHEALYGKAWYFAAISAAAAAQRSVIGLPSSGAGCTMPGTPCSAPMEGGCAVFSDFVPELLKITQFYHFFMLK